MNMPLTGFMCIALLMNFAGCAPKEVVRLDLNRFNENPEAYEGKRIIFKTDIQTLIEDPAPYISRDIEVSGYARRGPAGFDWEFYLEDEAERSIKCYERTYRHSPWIRADMAVRKAQSKNEKMIVVGRFNPNFGIELDWIEYGGEIIDTDYKPNVPSLPIWWGGMGK